MKRESAILMMGSDPTDMDYEIYLVFKAGLSACLVALDKKLRQHKHLSNLMLMLHSNKFMFL
jgi:hypothetical protein